MKRVKAAQRREFRGSWRAPAHLMLKRRFPEVLALMQDEPTFHGHDHAIARDGLQFERGWLPLFVKLAHRLTVQTPPSKRGSYQILGVLVMGPTLGGSAAGQVSPNSQ